MIKFVVIFLFIFQSLFATEILYLSSVDGIDVKQVGQNGELKKIQSLSIVNAGPIAISPDKKFLYTATRNKKLIELISCSIADDGTLKLLKKVKINAYPSYLLTDKTGQYLTGSHYREGTASIWALNKGVYEGTISDQLKLEQKAHAVMFSADNKFLFVPATGPNKIFQHHFDVHSGKTKANDKPFAEGPKSGAMQPRHMIFHPSAHIAYSTLERTKPGVGIWQWSPEKGQLTFLESITLADTSETFLTTADLHMTSNKKFLYVSLRDKKAKENQIFAFKILEDGKLNLIKGFPCEHIPRSFCLSQNDKFLYVAGQGDAKLGVYKVEDSGELSKVKQYNVGQKPTWVTTITK